jgi:hypothetical protein
MGIWGSKSMEWISLNSLFGISFVVTPTPEEIDLWFKTKHSQFPFWDFFCCNRRHPPVSEGVVDRKTLNSLFGISFVVTEAARTARRYCGHLSIPFLGFLLL